MKPEDFSETPDNPSFRGLRKEVLYPELSHSIVGDAIKVLNTLKPGLNEKAYENALLIELKKRGHTIEQQRRFDVFYDTSIPQKTAVRA